MSNFIEVFAEQQKENFEAFPTALAEIIVLDLVDSIKGYLGQEFKKDGSEATLDLPHGTYRVALKGSGEAANINVGFEFTKGFSKLLNDEEILDDAMVPKDFIEFFTEVMLGEKPEITTRKTMAVDQAMAAHFITSFSTIIGDLGRQYAVEGKDYTFSIPGLGKFTFRTDGKKITAQFEADKSFKRFNKDDEAGSEEE